MTKKWTYFIKVHNMEINVHIMVIKSILWTYQCDLQNQLQAQQELPAGHRTAVYDLVTGIPQVEYLGGTPELMPAAPESIAGPQVPRLVRFEKPGFINCYKTVAGIAVIIAQDKLPALQAEADPAIVAGRIRDLLPGAAVPRQVGSHGGSEHIGGFQRELHPGSGTLPGDAVCRFQPAAMHFRQVMGRPDGAAQPVDPVADVAVKYRRFLLYHPSVRIGVRPFLIQLPFQTKAPVFVPAPLGL